MVKKDKKNTSILRIIVLIFLIILCLYFILVSIAWFIEKNSDETITPGLIWSTNQGEMEWHAANKTCSNLGQRLPNHLELKLALDNQFYYGENNSFDQNKKYWSSSKSIGELYYSGWGSYTGDVVINAEKSKFTYSVRCVK